MAFNPAALVEEAGADKPLAEPRASTGRFRLTMLRFLRNKGSLVGLVVVALMFVGAFGSGLFYQWNYMTPDFNALLSGPSAAHWFGTTQDGQDMFALCMRGLQKSLIIGLVGGVLTTTIAAVVGAMAGYYGGLADRLLSWVIDLFLVLPSFLMLSILSPWFKGQTWTILIPLISAFAWMITARVVRAQTLTLAGREFVSAARFMGVPGWRIILRHILPNIASLLIIDAVLNVAGSVMAEVGLSFFGFGIQPPDVSLGTLIDLGQQDLSGYQWLLIFPCGCLIVLLLAVNAIGDGLRDALDPTSQGAKKKVRGKDIEDLIAEAERPGSAPAGLVEVTEL
jgi:peptide/nickel transport system permease protein